MVRCTTNIEFIATLKIASNYYRAASRKNFMHKKQVRKQSPLHLLRDEIVELYVKQNILFTIKCILCDIMLFEVKTHSFRVTKNIWKTGEKL